MPRVVDHAVRRTALVEALWRVVRRSGIHAVSVRTVAAEAGTSPSGLRHYVTTQDELLGLGLAAVVERVEERLGRQLPLLSGREAACAVLEQFLPLDEDRRVETEVYLAFIGRAHADPDLRAIRDAADARARHGLRHALTLLADAGALGAGRDLEQETDRLYALLDGLAMHGALMPDRYPPQVQRRVLAAHVAELGAARAWVSRRPVR